MFKLTRHASPCARHAYRYGPKCAHKASAHSARFNTSSLKARGHVQAHTASAQNTRLTLSCTDASEAHTSPSTRPQALEHTQTRHTMCMHARGSIRTHMCASAHSLGSARTPVVGAAPQIKCWDSFARACWGQHLARASRRPWPFTYPPRSSVIDQVHCMPWRSCAPLLRGRAGGPSPPSPLAVPWYHHHTPSEACGANRKRAWRAHRSRPMRFSPQAPSPATAPFPLAVPWDHHLTPSEACGANRRRVWCALTSGPMRFPGSRCGP